MSVKCIYNDEDFYFHHSVSENPDANEFVMHAHEWNELLFVITGKGTFLVEGTEYPVKDGSIFITREGETHKMMVSPDIPYERFSLHFNKNVFSQIDTDNILLEAFYSRKLGKNNKIELSFPEEKISNITKLDMKTEPAKVKLTIYSFLLSALIDISNNHVFEDILKDANMLGRNFEIIDYVNTNISENLSLEFLSSKFYISKSQLNRTFKKITGSTLWDYVIIKRLLLAKSYMKNGMQISEAYKRCGFNDYSSFYRAYRKRFGEPPKFAK